MCGSSFSSADINSQFWFFLQKLVRPRRAQKRELCRRGRHREFRATGAFTVSAGAAKLCATSHVSS